MRFLIVDDHPILRLGVRQLVLQGWPDAHIDEADNIVAACACARAAQGQIDAIVLDLVMPDVSGSDGVERMLEVAGATPILVLSFSAESKSAARLLQLGAAGYLPKDHATDELVVALRRVIAGKRYVTATLADHLVELLGSGKSGDVPLHETLSAQERRVMLELAAGRPPAQIGDALGISARTVGTYRTRIFDKTGWKSNVELAKYCLVNGLT